MSDRSMIKLIHADGFFPPGDAEKYCSVVKNLKFQEMPYGQEILNFNMIFPKIEPILGKALGERVIVDNKRSGIFRKPFNNLIHFESFDSLNEWCFIIALERTTLNLWNHISDPSLGEVSPTDAETALDGHKFDYKNLFEWKIHTNIVMQPNNGVFIRPWVFHSLQDGLVQYYKLITDRKFRVLVMGLPESKRSEVSKKLTEMIPNSVLLNSREIRKQEKDIDFSNDGRMRNIYRLLSMARNKTEDCVIIDSVCPLPEMREILNPDIIVWVNDIDKCSIEEVNSSFIKPTFYDVKCDEVTEKTYTEIIDKIKSKRI
jgi:hypothetical protein